MENIDKDANEIQSLLLAEVKKLFPEWPEPKSVKCQKWRYSQVFVSTLHREEKIELFKYIFSDRSLKATQAPLVM
jgi:hypothetical protein